MNFSKTKKLFIVALLVTLIPAQTQAWSWNDVTNFFKKSGQTIAIVAASFVSVAALAAVVNYFYKAKKQNNVTNKEKAIKHVQSPRRENNYKKTFAAKLKRACELKTIYENDEKTVLQKYIDNLEHNLNVIVKQLNNPRNEEHFADLLTKLHKITALLFNLQLRCTGNLYDTLKQRYEKLTAEAQFETATINTLYSVLGFSSNHAGIRSNIQIIRNKIENLSGQERSEKLVKLLIKTVGNPFAKENYDAYLQGERFTRTLQISDHAMQARISRLFNLGDETGKAIQKGQQEAAQAPAPQVAVAVNQNDLLRAQIADNDLAQSIIESDLGSEIPDNDLTTSREYLKTPVVIADAERGTSVSATVTVAPIATRTQDNAKKDEKIAAEAIDFKQMFEQTRSKVDTAIAQAEKIAAQKEASEQELSDVIAKLEQLREEVCSYPTENEDLKKKYELNFRSTPDIKPTEAYKALIRLNALNENEEWQKLDAKTMYQRIQARIAVMRTYQAAETKLHELRQLGYIFRNDITKAMYDAFIAGKQVKGIDSKMIAEVSANISAKKSALDTMKQLLTRKDDDSEEYEYVEKVGRPSRPDFVTRTVRIPHAQIALHAPIAVAPQPPYSAEASNGRPAQASQQSYMSIALDALKYLFKH